MNENRKQERDTKKAKKQYKNRRLENVKEINQYDGIEIMRKEKKSIFYCSV